MSQLNRQEGIEKQKKCRQCKESFIAFNSLHVVCSVPCARARVDADKDKAERKEIKAAKERIKTKGDHTREAQQAFNEFIRLRDRLAGHPCISSGKTLEWRANAVDAGHYRSRGSAPHLKFDENNCHAQSKQENRFLSGNVVDYRINLIKRIGLEAVEALEADQSEKRYTIEDLKNIKAEYREKTRQLKKQIAGECA
jgi:hypothetical protein